jgi:hypothetical protein
MARRQRISIHAFEMLELLPKNGDWHELGDEPNNGETINELLALGLIDIHYTPIRNQIQVPARLRISDFYRRKLLEPDDFGDLWVPEALA